MRSSFGHFSHHQTQHNRSTPPLQNSLNRNNRVDSFNIKLPSTSSFRASLTGIAKRANVDLKLFNQKGAVVAVSRRLGNNPEVVSVERLDAGNYTLRTILKQGQKSNYQLSFDSSTRSGIVLDAEPVFSFDSSVQTAWEGNSAATAKDWGKISAVPSTITGRLGQGTDAWYKVTVGETEGTSNRLALALSGDAGVFANVYSETDLFASLGNVVADGVRTSSGSSEVALGANTYFVKVSPVSGNAVNYKLNLSATGIPDGVGNTPETALQVNNLQPLNQGDQSFTTTDFVGHGDIFDYYTFKTDAKSTLTVTFDRLSDDTPSKTRIQYQLDRVDGLPSAKPDWKNAYGVSLSGGIDALTRSSHTVSGELEPGTYTLQLKSYFYNGDNDYRITFSAAPC